ncbi:CYTH domain-containing protein [Ancylomarina longa]|uniref:CYTH domain-containing protein n=1 Tax=Ancylomarina longa TaxID=2487017 RepID=A0A434AVX6_9BACT|nr:CYTH domain-containing protein [Ancylomarina longa]RUT78620.1 CYTH domain-containing protein [Ancylomarina longa]
MAIEIERKFLVNTNLLPQLENGKKLTQGYIWNESNKSLRIRITDTKSFLTIKSGNNPLCRSEFEYEIPMTDAKELLRLCDTKIEKTRYLIPIENHTWEIDIFEGKNQGLIIAEIELSSEKESFFLPKWINKEVSQESKYLNVELIKHPFTEWREG